MKLLLGVVTAVKKDKKSLGYASNVGIINKQDKNLHLHNILYIFVIRFDVKFTG